MASQSSLEELSVDPTTPQPLDLDLPDTKGIQTSASPSASMMVAGEPSLAYHSSSMTPPPSSQVPDTRHVASPDRTITPDATILSSPPPTATIPNGVKNDAYSTSPFKPPSQEQIASATTLELQDMIKSVLAENRKLGITVNEARMNAAHYKLQHTLLTMESEETVKRMEVEHDLTRREVQALLSHGRDFVGYDYTTKLKTYCVAKEEENKIIYRRLYNAKKVIRKHEEELEKSTELNARLRERIRTNREHVNALRSPGGPLYMGGTPKSSPSTPQAYRATPKMTPSTVRSVRHQDTGSARPFNILLEADKVLSQENNSAPSTPIVSRRPDVRTPNRHHRGVQSLSSLPNTPGGTRPITGNSALLPSAQFPNEGEARVASTLGWGAIHASRERRRKSRDSTISAEDADNIVTATGKSFRDESEEIQESQASQSATEMLRIDPRESFEVAASRTTTPTPGDKSTLQQAKIFGSVTKSVAEKRKRAEEEASIEHHLPKKLKATATEAIGIGLGIGLDTTRA